MNRFVLLCMASALSLPAFAQSPIGKGGRQLNMGFGLYSRSWPVYAGMDFGIHEDITAGPQVGMDLALNYLTISGRGDYHFNTLLQIPRDWDFYAGLNIGVAAGLRNDRVSGLDLGLQVGGRYYWNSQWAINLEFGGGSNLSGGRFGVSKRL